VRHGWFEGVEPRTVASYERELAALIALLRETIERDRFPRY
jgi:hypothetical protein